MTEQVSFDSEQLIVVDKDDNILDYKSKIECHTGSGILHRAFSIFIFDSQKRLILQKRSGQKLLWPLFWSNSCCSHPRKDESYEKAVHRRLKEELGLETKLHYLYKFVYQVPFKQIGSEYELCSVYIGRSDAEVISNPYEIAEWKYIDQKSLDREMETNESDYTPWFRMEWKQLRGKYQPDIDRLFT